MSFVLKLRALAAALSSKRMIVVLLLGFSSGLPLMILYSTMKIWLRREHIDLSLIGYASWVTVPYAFKFVWAPLIDRFRWPLLGRRRGWLLITQIGLILSLIAFGFSNPSVSLSSFLWLAGLVGFFSASQDIVVDAYRREILKDEELGIGSSIAQYGYRVGMLVTSGLGLWVVDAPGLKWSFGQSMWMLAGFMVIGALTSLWASEPQVQYSTNTPKNWRDEVFAYLSPFKDLLKRSGVVWILCFLFFYKFGDAIAGSMLGPFYVDMGYSNQTIAEVAKGFGFISSMVGLAVGGLVLFYLPMRFALFLFGILQMLSTILFSLITFTGPLFSSLVVVVCFEDLSAGLGNAAMVAFISKFSNREFSGSQYALMGSLAGLGRTLFSGFAGDLVHAYGGYRIFFLACGLMAIPGLILISKIRQPETRPA